MKNLIVLINMMILAGCSTANHGTREIDMRVNSYTVECVGEMEGTCLLVQEGDKIGGIEWEYFYYHDSIIGFDYEPGYIYMLKLEKRKIDNPPQDGSSFEYELISIVSKEKV
ncbi:DUF4377 domain-containing protein [Antarcticibacterium arcticum]|uniref:DUF4377 domain-containing protein n=1 Tax=Antarcticibacterium arcticum TaxID=2585771 RepID=A0A5B8YJ80_9FLAO|nr:DUF4377 domain-containing protein [Antarcticibacterium arcticum]QED38000.1 DUF4377 domain-containing protein [Antarcticibacterium arcticum]